MASAALMEFAQGLSSAATGSLVTAVWQGTLLAGAAGLGLRLLPRIPAAARFAIWFAVFVMVAALPLGVWAHSAALLGVGDGTPGAWLTVNSRWGEAVLVLWLAMSLVRAVTLGVGAVRVRELWRRATPVEIKGISAANEDGERGFGRKIQICTSEEVDRPSVIGFLAPKILIPVWLVEKLTPEEMTQVVLHEAGHLRRADDWLNLLQKIALVLFPLNPALAWVERQLCFERELACDERVLKATGAPKAYATCLAVLAEQRMTRRGMALVMGALGRESELGQRVRRILSRREYMRPMRARFVMVGAVLALAAGAVGLEQCPQLVGFSSGPQPSSRMAAVAGRVNYRDAVYRPELNPRRIDAVARQRVENAPGFGNDEGSRDVKALPVRSLRQSPKATRPRPPVDAVPRGEWLMMTSWTQVDAGQGIRVVMSSIQAGSAAHMFRTAAVMAPAGDGREAEDNAAGPVPADQPRIRQISPYAAVPFPGGWLVIQL